ncbi:hypothetical protein KW846_27365 [Pseudomonas sp. PDM32]|uniref:hypothetical protein n=1 Tax=Pseudomonas sp. PDM32 TaxID=2854768 RepID=UPI001C47248E|nr:hypothetical protein [Pseudomonas sp. PDM32]MBV7576445.1 hypothetical protein [Pseudomonas sp. PDM32]
MHEALTTIQTQLEAVIAQIKATVPSDEPFGIAHGNWSFPGLTRSELIEEAQSIIELIDDNGIDELGSSESRIKDYARRITYLHGNTVPNIWGSAGTAIPTYMLTLEGLRKALEPVLKADERAEAQAKIRRLTVQLRAMESRVKALDPRTTDLNSMVERIEQAYNAADQLPADLEQLSEAQNTIDDLAKAAAKDQSRILTLREHADELDGLLKKSAEDAEAVLKRCETAYSAATSVGLAAAFSERSIALSKSMWFWVAGLAVALVGGSYFGSNQLHTLSELFQIPNISTSVVTLNLLLSLLSVGAPVWFSWLATKQIGQRFRLAEDYAFKASISRAYEGFRREAAGFDKEMEAKLLTSALARFDELPLRLVEPDSHGSPWHELASSDVVKQAFKAVPGFAEQIKDLAGKAVDAMTPSKAKPAPAPAPTE